MEFHNVNKYTPRDGLPHTVVHQGLYMRVGVIMERNATMSSIHTITSVRTVTGRASAMRTATGSHKI